MRREERAVVGKENLEAIIEKAEIVHIAMCKDNKPYVVPVNFGYKDQTLYFHCALEGKKLEILKVNPEVAFEMVSEHKVQTGELACQYTAKYESVFGTGLAEIVLETTEKIKALDILMNQYDKTQKFTYNEKALARVAVVKISIQTLTGKSSLKKS